jgi:hypothetical protein
MAGQTEHPALDREREEDELQSGEPVQTAADGEGPLWQRDYIGVIVDTQYAPEDVARMLLTEFPRFSPDALARFTRRTDPAQPLQLGEDIEIDLKGYGHCAVRVVHLDSRSLTLRTLEGHLEAGRITFGAYHDELGRLVFRIRSRSRIAGPIRYVGYRLFGMPLQASIWTEFIRRVCHAVGGQLVGEVRVEDRKVEDSAADRGEWDHPTFTPEDRTGAESDRG